MNALITKDTEEEIRNLLNGKYEGRSIIQQAKDDELNYWRQMEWPGFHIEHLCRTSLTALSGSESKSFTERVGKTTFDSTLEMEQQLLPAGLPAEVKLSLRKKPTVRYPPSIILNDTESMDKAIKTGGILLLLFQGTAQMDTTGEFRDWLTELQGGPSKETLKNQKQGRPRRARKTSFVMEQCQVVLLDETTIGSLQSRPQGRNSGKGAPRMDKYHLKPYDFLLNHPDHVQVIRAQD